ncbi:transcriptional regulator, GntR family [Kribbella flavida DSM 17836]|uniref:Transcriptional regulator, GntR family n=1 Tax=Kribbella flavida (strain DSM 17836 / JCM 10339 / NBRC 14399) TaxID=479435 RepID=D2PSD1_KRIFD|nr:GntR family transcriptional regulator [Kribbella flavida]ADB31255.1 transcriptional regulator, GntR family [Kribbella flavida DSM 17836]
MAKPRTPAEKAAPKPRSRGEEELLPSGSVRVKVYAGLDQVTKTRLYLTETVKPGPDQKKLVKQAKTRLLNEIDEQRNPKTRATLGQLIERHLEVADIAESTRRDYESKYRLHIAPHLGSLPLTKLGDAEALDSLYATMRRCSKHCTKRQRLIDHRTEKAGHLCDEHRDQPCKPPNPDGCRSCRRACKSHVCVPLADNTIRTIHWIISGALARGVKWKWISRNPAEQADKPSMPTPNPRPPSAAEAARLINAAYAISVDWGEFIFSKATTGNRRGEHCALQWKHLEDPEDTDEAAVIDVHQALAKAPGGGWAIKDTKTHQHRRTVLDPETRLMLQERYRRKQAEAAALGATLRRTAYIFSPEPDGVAPLKPDTATQKFARMASRLGIDAELKNWRAYHATELITAGADINVVASRLGHGGGGSTTLKSYTAYHAERSQRAAGAMVVRMPARPAVRSEPESDKSAKILSLPRADAEEREPYRQIADDLRGAILCGFVGAGAPLPPMKTLAERYGVAVSTAHRAVALLVEAGLVTASRGVRATVVAQPRGR